MCINSFSSSGGRPLQVQQQKSLGRSSLGAYRPLEKDLWTEERVKRVSMSYCFSSDFQSTRQQFCSCARGSSESTRDVQLWAAHSAALTRNGLGSCICIIWIFLFCRCTNSPFLSHKAAPPQKDLHPHSIWGSFNINTYFDNFKPSQLENSAKVLLRSTAGT